MANYWHLSMITLSLFFVSIALATSSFSLKKQVTCNEDDLSALVKFKQSFSVNKSTSDYEDAYPKLTSWKLNVSDCCLWDGVVCSEDTGHVVGLDLGSSFIYGPLNSNSSLFHLVHLQTLDLSDNHFMHSQIPSAIAALSQLRSLNLSLSAFSGQIPNEISHLTRLVSLDLMSSLDLSGKPLLKLQNPSFKHLVQNLTELEELCLSQVNISSQVPTILTTFTSLRLIYLRDCGLRGEFPNGIFHLPKLQFLSVRYNQDLSGYLPEFQNGSRLEDMRLSRTRFNGSLPASLNNLTKLTTLDLGYNLFTGQMPQLESLSHLTSLALDRNEFDADYLPKWLGKLPKLQGLNLVYTNLHGTMPPFLSNLTHLTTLSLTSNHITGPIPSWLMNLTQFSIMDLRDNQLQGTIPPIFSPLKNLAFLTLSSNNFSCVVKADMFHNLNKLYFLGLERVRKARFLNKVSFVLFQSYSDLTSYIQEATSCSLTIH